MLQNWKNSHAFCQSNGMKLAKITSEEQANLLKSAYHPRVFNGCKNVNKILSLL